MEAAQDQRVVTEEDEQTIGVPSEETVMENEDPGTTKELEVGSELIKPEIKKNAGINLFFLEPPFDLALLPCAPFECRCRIRFSLLGL